MKKSRREKPPSLHVETASPDPSPSCSAVLSGWDADDEGFMSSGESLASRPLSLAIPSGPYCPRRPTLQEVLANSAPPPWTLSAFMQYLSRNHCLETLEFTMDASRYRKHYETMLSNNNLEELISTTEECEYIRMLWQKLLAAYITPNGPREVNLPSDVRDRLISLPNHSIPPSPTELDTAVKIIYELMDESVLVPFLNSVSSSVGSRNYCSPWSSQEDVTFSPASRESRSMSPARPPTRRDQSPPTSSGSNRETSSPFVGNMPRFSHHSHLTAALTRSGRHSAHLSPSSSSQDGQEGALTDDSTGTDSPSGSLPEPMTPPTTPPMSDIMLGTPTGISPKISREESSWKKMGSKFWKKSRSQNQSDSSPSSGSYPSSKATEAREDDIP
jgi:hypothetical protein